MRNSLLSLFMAEKLNMVRRPLLHNEKRSAAAPSTLSSQSKTRNCYDFQHDSDVIRVTCCNTHWISQHDSHNMRDLTDWDLMTPYGDMATRIWVNIGSGNGKLPDGTKPLPEPMLTYHQ